MSIGEKNNQNNKLKKNCCNRIGKSILNCKLWRFKILLNKKLMKESR